MAGGKLPRGGGSGYFRRLAEHVPPHIRTRVTEFIDSVAFKDEVRSEAEIAASSGEVAAHEHDSRYAPTDHGHVGFARSNHSHSWPTRIGQLLDVGILPPVDAGQVLIVNGAGSWQNQLPQFRSDLFAINGSEDETVSVVFDLSAISELEQRTIFAIDEDMTFPSAADWLDLTDGHDTTLHTHQHELLYGIGYYYHDEIDDHIDDATIHFTEDSIHHPEPVTVAVSPGPSVTLGDDVVVTGVAPVTPTHVDAVAELVFLVTGEIVMA